jgi:hypothetical protein
LFSVKQLMEPALNLHDALLLQQPAGAVHDFTDCLFCTEWSMSEDGVPSGVSRLDLADAKEPYGKVTYADPGYQKDGVKRYPVDTEAHARAAWSYIHQAKNSSQYSADQLSNIRSKIAAALKRFNVEAEQKDKEVETPAKKADAKKASTSKGSKPDAASEGGTTKHMDTITQETHEALLEKALRDATAQLETEKATLESVVATLHEGAAAKDAELASLQSENERLNGELDTAQVALKTAQDEANNLRTEIADKEAEQQKADIASARAAQVRNLELFTEEYITERSARWADVEETAWNERLDEWKVAKGTSSPSPAAGKKTTDTASAMTGSNEVKTGSEPSARRLALGLS